MYPMERGEIVKYSIMVNQGWINFYDWFSKRYNVSLEVHERIHCSYELAVLIRDHLKEKGLMASLQPEFSKKME